MELSSYRTYRSQVQDSTIIFQEITSLKRVVPLSCNMSLNYIGLPLSYPRDHLNIHTNIHACMHAYIQGNVVSIKLCCTWQGFLYKRKILTTRTTIWGSLRSGAENWSLLELYELPDPDDEASVRLNLWDVSNSC